MELPLLLAGPILRRVDPGIVAVQVFLSKPATVKLTVYEGRVAFDTTNPAFATSDDPPDPNAPPPRPGEDTVRIGDKLHLGMISARLPPASGKVFQSDFLYSYNVSITTDGTTIDLAGLELLGEHTVNGVTAEPLGYDDRMLPSFALPPTTLDDLQIAYGSCRRPLYDDGDGLAWMDEYLADRVRDPQARIHQLFLGGDQIYADDVASLMMLRVAELGIELIGSSAGVPRERVKVDKVRKRPASTSPDPADPDAAYTDESAAETETLGDLPAGLVHFPLDTRLDLTTRSAQFTSEDGTNHLISFGEFAATYLLVWSPACWGLEVPGVQKLPTVGAASGPPLAWLDTLTDGQDVKFPDQGFPERVPQHLYATKAEIAARAAKAAKKNAGKTAEEIAAERARSRVSGQRVHRDFLLGLGKVQRVLANVPTYMILDDHDVTDDYFLNVIWRRRVLQSVLGQVILTNAMFAYALFQDWGNDPRRYDQTTTPAHPELGGLLPGDLLDRADEVFLQHSDRSPDEEAFAVLGRMFGHDLDNAPTPDGRFSAVRPRSGRNPSTTP